jgi:hypothetical protein
MGRASHGPEWGARSARTWRAFGAHLVRIRRGRGRYPSAAECASDARLGPEQGQARGRSGALREAGVDRADQAAWSPSIFLTSTSAAGPALTSAHEAVMTYTR